MRAVIYDTFRAVPEVREVSAPVLPSDGAIIRVEATGLCRSDWHGWMGHDADIVPPHIPGHEFAGTIERLGDDVRGGWRVGDRVTAPFVCACGACPTCQAGDHQICDAQEQPGFTYHGSFAELVAVPHADINLVRLPDELSFATAASLGCRFATAYRAAVAQGRLAAGEWLAVFGCGGVGLSAVMIGASLGARVVAIDVSSAALAAARAAGAEAVLDASAAALAVARAAGSEAAVDASPGDGAADVARAVRAVTGGGAHLTIDALGSRATAIAAVSSLRKRGRHVQVGLLLAEDARPPLPMELVISRELEIRGSHGLAAHEYAPMLEAIAMGRLRPDMLVGRTITLDQAPAALVAMGGPPATPGMTVILPSG